jgi:hypothetical protein
MGSRLRGRIAAITIMTGVLAAGTAGSAAAGTVAPVAASSGARYPITGIRGWPDAGDLMLQGTPPVSAIVRIHLPIDGQPAWTFAWFGYTTGHRDEGLQLCLESLDGATEAQGTINSSCGIASLPAGKAVAVVNELGADAGSEIGVASSEITSVIARPPGAAELHQRQHRAVAADQWRDHGPAGPGGRANRLPRRWIR